VARPSCKAVYAGLLLELAVLAGNTGKKPHAGLVGSTGRQARDGRGAGVGAGAGTLAALSALLLSENIAARYAGAAQDGRGAASPFGHQSLRVAPRIGAFPILFTTKSDGLTLALSDYIARLWLACGCFSAPAPAGPYGTAGTHRDRGCAPVPNTPPAGRCAAKVWMGLGSSDLRWVVLIAAALSGEFFRSERKTDRDSGPVRAFLLAAYDLADGIPDPEASMRPRICLHGPDGTGCGFPNRTSEPPGHQHTNVPLDLNEIPGAAFRLSVAQARCGTEGGGRIYRAIANTVTPGYFQG